MLLADLCRASGYICQVSVKLVLDCVGLSVRQVCEVSSDCHEQNYYAVRQLHAYWTGEIFENAHWLWIVQCVPHWVTCIGVVE